MAALADPNNSSDRVDRIEVAPDQTKVKRNDPHSKEVAVTPAEDEKDGHVSLSTLMAVLVSPPGLKQDGHS